MSDEKPASEGHWWDAFPNFISAAREVATSSAMAPLQWVLGITGAFSLFGAIFVPQVELKWAFVGTFAVCLGYVLFVYDSFRRQDPNRLHSESFIHAQSVLKQERYLLLDERNRASPKLIDTTPVSNTHPVSLQTTVGTNIAIGTEVIRATPQDGAEGEERA